VALGRALLSGPDLLLLDEPLAGADAALRRRLLGHLLRAQEEFAVPSLVVSHDPTEVRLLAREAIVIERGRVAARGRPDDLFAGPSTLELAWDENYENVLRARVVTVGAATADAEIEAGLRLTVPGRGLEPGQPIAIVVRAEEIIVAIDPPHGLSAQNVLPATILERRPAAATAAGGEAVAVVTAVGRGAARVIAALTEQACDRLGLVPGRAVHLVMKTHSCRVYPARATGPAADVAGRREGAARGEAPDLPHNVPPREGGDR
jgi:molybdate transport system ATP-binding protein